MTAPPTRTRTSNREVRRTAQLVAVCFVLALAVVALATLLPLVTLNPRGTDAVVYGKVHVVGDSDGAFLNLTPHSGVPLSGAGEGLFIVHNPSEHLVCFRVGATNHCASADLVP